MCRTEKKERKILAYVALCHMRNARGSSVCIKCRYIVDTKIRVKFYDLWSTHRGIMSTEYNLWC